MGKLRDLTGQKIGMLTVIGRDNDSQDGKVRWLCKCDCGNPKLKSITTSNLSNHKTRSCGCIFTEMLHKRKKHNTYDLSGEYGIGYTSNVNSKNENVFYFDLEDYEKIKDYCWCFKGDDYLTTTILKDDETRSSIMMHQLILPTENGYMPDHIHGKESRNDNRKSNLRIVTKSQNAMNQGLRSDNRSGVRGVYWNEHANMWIADIQKDGKRHYLGVFSNFNDAVNARKEAEKKYFGEYAYDASQVM